MKLQELRDKWEIDLEIKAELEEEDGSMIIVILQDDNEKYHVHRYFSIDHKTWSVSADIQQGSLDNVWEMLHQHF